MINPQVNNIQTQMAPGQSRPIVQYLRSPGTVGAYPAPQPPIDPRMEVLRRRLALLSKTGDQNQMERSISGKDSMGRPQPQNTLEKGKINGYSN